MRGGFALNLPFANRRQGRRGGIAAPHGTISRGRILFFSFVALLACALLLSRSWWLQGVRGETFGEISLSNILHDRVLKPPRGVILDRHGMVLATNHPSFDLTFLPKGVPREEYPRLAAALASITNQDTAAVLKILVEARKRPLSSFPVAQNVTSRIVAWVAEHRSELPGVIIEERAVRFYPSGPAAAHLLGYIGEASPEEIDKEKSYSPGDWIGRAGLEKSFDENLFGLKGHEKVWLDALGQSVKRLSIDPPTSGDRVTLTIDADLQKWVDEAFHGKMGALAAIEPATGKVLALYSAPAYDPNLFLAPGKSGARLALFSDTHIPLYNRALMATYSPGSTFKTVTMMAGLRSKRLFPSTRFTCSGEYAGMKCWKKEGHGTLDMMSAFQNSCNVWFYQAGERVWSDPIFETAEGLGLNKPPGLGIGPEANGVVPNEAWERKNVKGPDGEHWGTGDVRNTAIGQGYVSVSPVQMARLVGAASLGGKLMKPMIVESVEAPDGGILREYRSELESDMKLSPEHLAVVRAAMKAVVDAGTGRRAQIPGLSVGGKTGTAQNPHGADHAWFIGVAPIENPQIAICVLVEHAGMGGGMAAAPIAREVIGKYALKKKWIAELPPPALPPVLAAQLTDTRPD